MSAYSRPVARVFERFPILGVTVGAAMFLGFGALSVSSAWKVTHFAKEPRVTTLAEAAASPGGTNWVTLTDARWICDRAVMSHEDDGKVRYTYVPATGPAGTFVLIALSGPADCAALSAQPVTGVLHEMNPLLRSSLVEDEHADFSGFPQRGYVLSTYLGPADSRTGIWIAGLLALLGGVVIWWYGKLMRSR